VILVLCGGGEIAAATAVVIMANLQGFFQEFNASKFVVFR
jgi:hypothetical protein